MTDTRHDKSKSIVGRLFAICAFTLAVCGCGGGIGGGIGGGGRRVDIGGGVIIDMVPIDAPSGVYYMQKTEVTQALWKSVMGENPSYFKGDDRPVECVSWNDCQSFIEKLNGLPSVGKSGLVFRLPTEEEWEYACRAGSAGDYCKLADGSEITEETLGTVAWYDDNSNDETHPVGQKQPNAFGLYDMHGNVWEWTSTPGGGDRVFRGGCWYGNAGYCTCGYRYGDNPGRRDDALGLRLVMTADEMSAIAELTGQMVDVPGKDYKMCKYEVTQALWKSVMGENPSRFKGDDRPVERVSWNDCQSFIEKLNGLPSVRKSGLVFRLPTEEEWEYACRAGSAGDYCKLADGTEITEDTLESVAWCGEDWENGSTHSVGRKQPNAFGLYDMHGNVWVWTSTADGGLRVVRGGSWYNLADDCTCGNRGRLGPDDRDDNLGLRLAMTADEMSAIAELTGQMVDVPGKDYKMCKYEVTQALWKSVMGDNPSEFKGADRPVERVSWNDCQEFLEKLNAMPEVKKTGLTYRLPTEEEWVHACRAGSDGYYCKLADGSEITKETLGTVAWYDDNSNDETHPVGQKQPNAFGLYDMHGNVWEWTSTDVGGCRVDRGGSWISNAGYCTCGNRSRGYPGNRNYNLGLRLAASAGL